MRDPNEPANSDIENLKILMQAFRSITFDEFAAVLAECGHEVGYAKQVWSAFQHNPFGYMISRNPICQGNALIEFLFDRCRKIEREKEMGNPT